MYKNGFFKNYLIGFLLFLIIGCTSKDSSSEYVEEQEVDNPSELNEASKIDEHTIGHIFHAMGVVHSKNDRKSLGKNIKVFYFSEKDGYFETIPSKKDAKLIVYFYDNIYAGEAPISISGKEAFIFVGITSDFTKIINSNLHGAKSDLIGTFRDLDIKNSKLEVTVDESNPDAKTFLKSVNYIIDGVVKISPMMMN
ncbi:outer surface lipoprotein [Borreliella chilensis]|uniref:Outer surface lipoprotein n=1 Tax=Borreliella chilensis TaxID=1245910 RepID=A0A0A7V1U0_9SPIR|nr:outer surface lipoprotein [Borreliella chilensis]